MEEPQQNPLPPEDEVRDIDEPETEDLDIDQEPEIVLEEALKNG